MYLLPSPLMREGRAMYLLLSLLVREGLGMYLLLSPLVREGLGMCLLPSPLMREGQGLLAPLSLDGRGAGGEGEAATAAHSSARTEGVTS